MATWPATLPTTPLLNGYKRKPMNDGLKKFNPDLGATKDHLRYTAVPENVTENYLLTNAEYLILKSFYETDCKRGAITFFKTEPETNTLREYKFLEPPDTEQVGLDKRVTLTLRILP